MIEQHQQKSHTEGDLQNTFHAENALEGCGNMVQIPSEDRGKSGFRIPAECSSHCSVGSKRVPEHNCNYHRLTGLVNLPWVFVVFFFFKADYWAFS